MNQQAYLSSLKDALTKHNVSHVDEIIQDYEEHFRHGLKSGKTEEEISAKLGSPTIIAKAYETENLIAEVKGSKFKMNFGSFMRVLGRLLVIAPVNVILLLIPGFVVLGTLVAGWSVAGVMGVVGMLLLGVAMVTGMISLSIWTVLALGSAGMVAFGLCIIGLIAMYLISKYVWIALVHYAQWNLKFVLEK